MVFFSELRKNFSVLPNDQSEELFLLEEKFIKTNKLNKITCESDLNLGAAIFSRTHNAWYYWPKGKPMSFQDLNLFEKTGHTLGIDNRLTYSRMAAWDFDCMCRKKDGNSFGEIACTKEDHMFKIINSIIDELYYLKGMDLKKGEKSKKDRINYTIWRNGCGFHLYTDFPISLPTHLSLNRILQDRFEGTAVLIEVPIIMPLPFSAKVFGKPYYLWYFHKEDMRTHNLVHETNQFWETFSYLSNLIANTSSDPVVGHVNTVEGNHLIIEKQIAMKKSTKPNFPTLTLIELNNHLDPLAQFFNFVKFMNQRTSNILAPPDPIVHNKNINEFIRMFNQRFRRENSETWKFFLEAALVTHGSLYLQHYTVLLHKYLDEKKEIVDLIYLKNFLRELFAPFADQLYMSQFLDFYNESTFNMYANVSFEEMFNYLWVIDVYEINPNMSASECITKYMEHKLNVDDVAKYCDELITNPETFCLRESLLPFVKMYVEGLKIFRFIVTDGLKSWYEFSEQGTYIFSGKESSLRFPGLSEWFAFDNKTKKALTVLIMSFSNEMVVKYMWTDSYFLISTTEGLFNAATGLYSARCPFLRFCTIRQPYLRCRELPQLPSRREKLMQYNNTNFPRLKIVCNLLEKIIEQVEEIYLHFILNPALVSIGYAAHIDEKVMRNLFERLSNYKHAAGSYFFVDCNNFSAKYCAALIQIIRSVDIEIFCSYRKLSYRFMKTTRKPSVEEWKNVFEHLDGITFDNSCLTPMQKMLSLEVEGKKTTEEECFFASVLGACLLKCVSFKSLVCAFDDNNTPHHLLRSVSINLPYTTSCDMKTNMQKNLDYAKSVCFGGNLSKFEKGMLDVLLKLLMSCSFCKGKFIELMNVLSNLMCVNNANKIFLVLYGDKNVGKSHLADILEGLAEPGYHRIMNLSSCNARSALSSNANLIIINEAKFVPIPELKFITGNDKNSGQKFFSQVYVKTNTQSMLIGCTNETIILTESNQKVCLVDRVTIERIHGICLTGKQAETGHNQDLITMMSSNSFERLILNTSLVDDSYYLGWSLFGWYFTFRTVNFIPPFQRDFEDARLYQERVYRANNILYNFLHNCGLMEVEHAYMETNKLSCIVKAEIEMGTSHYKQWENFVFDFTMHYKTSMQNELQNNLLEIDLYENILLNFSVEEEEGAAITMQALKERACLLYVNDVNKNVALVLFQIRNKKFFNGENGCYEGLTFFSEISPYQHQQQQHHQTEIFVNNKNVLQFMTK